jgi:hypothetical protein
MTAVGRHALVGSNPTPGASNIGSWPESVKDLWRFQDAPGGVEENACFITENVVLRLSQTLTVFETGSVGKFSRNST